MNIKPGNQTTEYWFAVISQFVVICLAVARIVAPEKEGEIDTLAKQILDFLTPLLPVIIPLIYSAHRTALKKANGPFYTVTSGYSQVVGEEDVEVEVDLTGDYAFESVLEQAIINLRKDDYTNEKDTTPDPGDVQAVGHDHERERPV
jgi:hypothetical protein